jgi:D-sedoheptulose 7-phosphate isomerase
MSRQKQSSTFLGPSFEASESSAKGAYQRIVVNALEERRIFLEEALSKFAVQAETLASVAVQLVETLRSGHKVLVAGNGGSAAEAQHFAAELVGRFKRDRAPYAVLSLTTDTSILTAVANDYGYQDVFARQVLAFGQPNDVLLAFSTSGESENLLRAAQASRQREMMTVAITGEAASSLEALSDIAIRVPLVDTALVQELHMIVTHILCDIVETRLSSENKDTSMVYRQEEQAEAIIWQTTSQEEWQA